MKFIFKLRKIFSVFFLFFSPPATAGKTKETRNKISYAFRDGGPYHIATSLLICSADQWTGLFLIGISVMKELNTAHLFFSFIIYICDVNSCNFITKTNK